MPGQQAPVAGCVRSVLVVDDDDRVRETVCEMLADGGFRARGIGDGSRAYAMLLAGDFDAAVVDLVLPGTSGLTIMRELAGQKRRVPVLYISAYGNLLDSASEYLCGAVAFLRKPFNADALLAAVEGLIGRRADAPEPDREA